MFRAARSNVPRSWLDNLFMTHGTDRLSPGPGYRDRRLPPDEGDSAAPGDHFGPEPLGGSGDEFTVSQHNTVPHFGPRDPTPAGEGATVDQQMDYTPRIGVLRT
jgi:hypothetical protein